ncbi:MAG: hypothetical protein UR69_C0003G0037 [Candidatus Moranbacteria bacterium GW2011_GWE2_35_2-]|nr:MAG: hypothetical protein UR69_C0003G0037 [Candidatus Moranbacteria bacterium GW2011_GWE2_35_2-]KKQ04599.1 MAG: hypothetical protein US15_C0050G0004 [Candidatus Moranbacteria bacterium GW2011_GWF1_36_4]KKQ22054.1 MAG: hypothetical protein US37_C0004G0013 [Candidatus Moranbacteria bacterium GW2011_GWF2_37_11]KKQ29192.1 MAG: hypothetical protein US44_C0003G0104 [Candidatus Moranbacteria bacterium GW2011_GWD1_37_17]KKQ31177.1 MAG: hypothetical protein US47_C0001G0410 [Candidatus Moranbacteria b
MMFGIVSQIKAVGVNSMQDENGQGQVSLPVEVDENGNAVMTQEQNQVKNERENTQIQTQEENTIQTRYDSVDKARMNEFNSKLSEQRRSKVANTVQSMLQIADQDGGVGQQLKAIAQNQNQNQLKLEQNVEKIQIRGGFTKFFVGPDYGKIKDTQKILEQNKEQIRQLNQIRTQLSNQGDQQQLTEQINILEQVNQEIEILLADAQEGFSLFGWFNKLIS